MTFVRNVSYWERKSHGATAGAIAVDEAIPGGLVNNSSDWLILRHIRSSKQYLVMTQCTTLY